MYEKTKKYKISKKVNATQFKNIKFKKFHIKRNKSYVDKSLLLRVLKEALITYMTDLYE